MIVGVLALIVLAGCGNAGAADDTGLTKEEAQQAAIEGTSVNGKMTIGNPSEILTTSSGSLVLSGAGIPDSPLTVSWNISIESGSTVLVTGQITVDGTTYSYDELGVTYGG